MASTLVGTLRGGHCCLRRLVHAGRANLAIRAMRAIHVIHVIHASHAERVIRDARVIHAERVIRDAHPGRTMRAGRRCSRRPRHPRCPPEVPRPLIDPS